MTHGNTTLASKHIAVFTVDKFEEERDFLSKSWTKSYLRKANEVTFKTFKFWRSNSLPRRKVVNILNADSKLSKISLLNLCASDKFEFENNTFGYQSWDSPIFCMKKVRQQILFSFENSKFKSEVSIQVVLYLNDPVYQFCINCIKVELFKYDYFKSLFSLLCLCEKSYSPNNLGCSVLKFWPNIFWIKALGQVCKFVLSCKKF